MSHFIHPAYLLLLIPVAALIAIYVVLQVRRKTFVARFSNVELLGSVAPRRPGWRRHLTFALLLIALTVLSFGVAKPTAAVEVPRDQATVMLAIDVSRSMQATDVLPTRIAAAQSAGKQFAKDLPKTINLGLVSFARYASILVSPTLDREQVATAIDSLELMDYTAIGEAIFGSLKTIASFQKATTPKGSKPVTTHIVLLSDGTNTTGRTVDSAIAAARKANVRISTIAFGRPDGTIVSNGQTILVPADTTTLSHIAQATGGSFHRAETESGLRSVYKDITSQIGYTTERRDISYRFLVVGLLTLFAAGAASMLWSGRLA